MFWKSSTMQCITKHCFEVKISNWCTLDDIKYFANNKIFFIYSLRSNNTNSIITLNCRSLVFMHAFESKSPSILTKIISSQNISRTTKGLIVKLSILKENIIYNDYLLYFDNHICAFNFCIIVYFNLLFMSTSTKKRALCL